MKFQLEWHEGVLTLLLDSNLTGPARSMPLRGFTFNVALTIIVGQVLEQIKSSRLFF